MAVISFSLTAVAQDVFQFADAAQQQAPPTATPVNANQAQGAPAPADTVTLTNRAAEGQQSGQDPNPGRFDRAAFLASAGLSIGANRAPADPQPNSQQAPPLPVLLPDLQPEGPAAAVPANTADAAANQNLSANAAANAPNSANVAAAAADGANAADAPPDAAAVGPQQQLQQLDQSLLQLGINPQSIPLANRMAMLLYANDPAALQLLVQALQTAATQQAGSQTGADTAATGNAATQALLQTAAQSNHGQPAPTQPIAPVTDAAPSTAASQAAPQFELLAAQIDFAGVQITSLNQPPQSAANQSSAANPASTPAQPNPLSVQIEELQIAIQSVEIQPGEAANTPAQTSSRGNALNVTA
jgi:hypothetical protein